ncbi:TRAP transporter large permease [Clostridium transplantifaecale]|uniref:TRAP transporter large permease n=1 Tax=Clostridium transplantifaecale TaxID=2479838 RepID=UPI000F63DF1E|nr:TRAP transporter large permease [Clostridium transplantifaecale]
MVTIVGVTFVVFLILNVPIAASLGLSAFLALIFEGGRLQPSLVTQLIYSATDSYSLMAIPFFMLAGSLMEVGGLSKRLIEFANACIGHVKGGFGVIAIVTSMFFAAISGSGPATVAALGGILIPAMKEEGYDVRYAAALMATAGAIGIIIPPSVPMIVYAVQAEVSVGNMFMAGFGPGFLIGGLLILVNFFVAKKNNYRGREQKTTAKEKLEAFKNAFFALLMPFIILGGIYGGIFTPTEAAGIAVVYGFVIGMFIYRELRIKDIPTIMVKAAVGSATILFIIMGASAFSYIVVSQGVPAKMAAWVTAATDSKVLILVLINLVLLIAGCFLDASSAIIVLVPLLLPLAKAVGVNAIHFGVIMVVNLAIGLVTPPVGLDLFVACNIAGISVGDIVKKLVVLLLISLLALLLVTYLPEISLFIPRLAGARGV